MLFSDLFEVDENLNLNKRTLIALRWIAIIGQLIAIFFVKFVLEFELPIILCTSVIFFGVLTNIFLRYGIKNEELNNLNSTIILFYDLLQLTILLFLTGGIKNPFVIFLIVPSIVSSTLLKSGSTFLLSLTTALILLIITFFHLPLPYPGIIHFHVPNYYLYSVPIAILIFLIFFTYFSSRFGIESRKKTEALNRLELIVAKEKELESIGLQAAAAVHSLGTPLSTINVIAKELKKEITSNPKYSKDIDLLLSQTKRCSEILKKISTSQIEDDKFLSKVTVKNLIIEMVRSFEEITEKKINLNSDNIKEELLMNRTAEITFGIRNFLGNAVKFSQSEVNIDILTFNNKIKISISDDGPGFPEDIVNLIGQPYIATKSKNISSKSGLGLGIFIGKTLLERNKAKINFSNKNSGGALVEIIWKISDIII